MDDHALITTNHVSVLEVKLLGLEAAGVLCGFGMAIKVLSHSCWVGRVQSWTTCVTTS